MGWGGGWGVVELLFFCFVTVRTPSGMERMLQNLVDTLHVILQTEFAFCEVVIFEIKQKIKKKSLTRSILGVAQHPRY